MFKIKLT